MAQDSNKRKLVETSSVTAPPIKRRRIDKVQQDCVVKVRFVNETKEFRRLDLMMIEFCKSKLQRWSANTENKDNEDDSIDFSIFPCITSFILSAIIELQKLFDASANSNEKYPRDIARLLLSNNIKVNHLPHLFESCKILLVTNIFNEQIFKHYFDEHPPITIDTFKKLQNIQQNGTFLSVIVSNIMNDRNIMNDWNVQKAMYDSYNDIGNKNIPFSGHIIPNSAHAMQYAIEQIQYEKEREGYRSEMYQRLDDAYEEYFGVDYYYEQKEKMTKALKEDIDYGLCAAFDDMVKYGTDITPFLKELFGFIDEKFCRNKSAVDHDGNILDRSQFCFYALAYIVHRIWILYLAQNNVIMNYVNYVEVERYRNPAKDKYISDAFYLYDRLLSHDITIRSKFLKSEKMRKLMKQRIRDSIKYRDEWNANNTKYNQGNDMDRMYKVDDFPRSVSVHLLKVIHNPPEWVINNFALKCNNSDCRKVMCDVLAFCTERKNKIKISQSLNNLFQQYLGVTLRNDDV